MQKKTFILFSVIFLTWCAYTNQNTIWWEQEKNNIVPEWMITTEMCYKKWWKIINQNTYWLQEKQWITKQFPCRETDELLWAVFYTTNVIKMDPDFCCLELNLNIQEKK